MRGRSVKNGFQERYPTEVGGTCPGCTFRLDAARNMVFWANTCAEHEKRCSGTVSDVRREVKKGDPEPHFNESRIDVARV